MCELIFNITTIVISLLALISSVIIGYKQTKISKMQSDLQNKVELYLLYHVVGHHIINNNEPDYLLPAIYIRNIGSNVIYLDNYIFNGREYPLGKEVLPPVSAYDGFHYIYLPTDNTEHISFEINFTDWQNQKWKTKGYADSRKGVWEITYSPCEKRDEKKR